MALCDPDACGDSGPCLRKGGKKTALKRINPTLFHYLAPDYRAYFKFVANSRGVFDTMEYYRRFAKIVFTRTATE